MMPSLFSSLYEDEAARVDALLERLPWGEQRAARVKGRALKMVERVRAGKHKAGELESFLQQYGLNTEEGLALMTLAEALLRVPDSETADALIRDKMAAADFFRAQAGSTDLFVKAAGMGLSMTQKTLDSAFSKLGAPVIRKAMIQAMGILGQQFVLGRDIGEGLKNAVKYEKKGYRMSYDMLGEGARTREAAEKFFATYDDALDKIADKANGGNGKAGRPGMSVKLSALYPRYEYHDHVDCVPALSEKLRHLARKAAAKNISLTVDAEEVERLETSLAVIEEVVRDKALNGWEGFGAAVQAYHKAAPEVIERLAELGGETGRKLQVRLVKGAYWDTEVKRAQVMGLDDFPVYTRKANTDLCFLSCAHQLMSARNRFFPMLATHNAHSIAAVIDMAGNEREGFEFQRLHGMGETLYDLVLTDHLAPVCVYAPCGSHEELLPYLVRRLLENGASTSFVHRILDERIAPEEIAADPVEDAAGHETRRHPKIALPADIYLACGEDRRNSKGMDLTQSAVVEPLIDALKTAADKKKWQAAPLIAGKVDKSGKDRDICNPANRRHVIGAVWTADETQIDRAFETALAGFQKWSETAAGDRAAALEKLADLMEENIEELMALCVFEAGKTIDDALAEVREAVDFCRYYAMRGRAAFADEGERLPGPTGERNILKLGGRGVFVCISPWNFPMAIFTGQITAALMAGNAVIAKPAEQTPLIAARVADLILQAGIAAEAFTLLPGDGAVGAKLVAHKDVAGVAFTGSTEAARSINRALAEKEGPIVPLIAETGGQNAMIVDSSALAEQVIDDVLLSAFGSAGQRCSALRVLCLQEDIADRMITMLKGAMAYRRVGLPIDLRTDIGPVIDAEALENLKAYRTRLETMGALIAEVPVENTLKDKGTFFAPVAFEIDSVGRLGREVFGPVLHVVRYKADKVDELIGQINALGYGLTFGVHSRIGHFTEHVTDAANVGNAYVNRGMTGAIVGAQPFGGRGLSGTGPKAGGPHYLPRFATEKVISTDTTRQGGNASLVTLDEDA